MARIRTLWREGEVAWAGHAEKDCCNEVGFGQCRDKHGGRAEQRALAGSDCFESQVYRQVSLALTEPVDQEQIVGVFDETAARQFPDRFVVDRGLKGGSRKSPRS